MNKRLRSVLSNFLRKREIERDLEDEVQAFVTLVADEKVASGISRSEANRQALAECGGVERVKQGVRNERSGVSLETLWQDLRFGARQLRRNPGFAIVTIVMLGVGIGANTAIFSFVDSVLLRSLPYPNAERLTMILTDQGNSSRAPASAFDLYQMRERSREFDQIAGIWVTNRVLPGKGDPEQGKVGVVTANFLSLFAARPALGRFFGPQDDLQSAPSTLILSHELWVRKFASDRNIIGTSVQLGGGASTVIGVLPEHFRLIFPEDASVPPQVDYFQSTPVRPWDPDGPAYLHLVGRLRNDSGLASAQGELRVIADQINSIRTRTRIPNYHLYAFSLKDDDVREVRRTLFLLFGAVGFIFFIGCANVANLLMVRSRQRLHEMTVRSALGASTQRLVQQIVSETLALVVVGCSLGALLGWASLRAIIALEPTSLRNLPQIVLDLHVLSFTFGLAILTSLLVSVAPISMVRRLRPSEDLKRSGRSTTPRQGLSARVLVASEVALAFVLLMGTGLLVRSFENVLRVDPGFRPQNVFTFRVSVPNVATLREVQRSLEAIPGVQSASSVSHLPLDDAGNWYDYYWKEQTPIELENTVMADMRSVLPGYFSAIGAELIQGRDFTESDDAAHLHVAVIDELLARDLWPSESPLGKRINVSDSPKGPFQFERDWVLVVGVVRHIQCHTLTEAVRPQMYLTYPLAPRPSMSMVIRTGTTLPDLATSVRKRIASLNRNVPITHLEPLTSLVDRAQAEIRFLSLLATLLSIVALQMALGGIYGVLSYSVTLRTAEIGIRIAIGAARRQILRLVLAEGFSPVIVGAAVGVLLSVLSMPLLDHLLFEIRPSSPQMYLCTIMLVMLLGGSSMLIPAVRAMRTDPVKALSCE